MSVYLREEGRHAITQSEIERDRVFACDLTYVEVSASLARAAFKEDPARLSAAGYQQALETFRDQWRDFGVAAISTEEIVEAAAELARTHLLRAYDAVHLAVALRLEDRLGGALYVSTWDRELARAARAEGLSLAHEVPL